MKIFGELKRRNVFRVGIAYLVGAWVLSQAADFVLQVLGAPDFVLRIIVAILALGIIPAVIISWVYEVTPEGVRKASEIDVQDSIAQHTGKKLEVVTIALLVVAIGLFVVDRFLPDNDQAGSPDQQAVTAPAEKFDESVIENDDTLTAIAVLPFANRSNQEDDLYFTDGIHDDLLTQLAKIGNLTVISRTSVMKYRNSMQSLGEIGAELNVGTILEGGVQKVGDRVRINAQLIEVSTDRHLWAETFDRELTAENVFDLQSEIARKIVGAIAVQLSPQEEQLLDEVPTQSLAAYDAYLRARNVFYGANYSRRKEEEAEPLVRRAIELDPGYADAHALLSHIYSQKYWRGTDTSESMLNNYRQSLERASALNPNSAEALRARANYYYRVENDYDRSLELLDRAMTIAPGNVDIHADRGLSLRRLGRWDESIASFKRALELDPENVFYRAIMLETMGYARKWQAVLDYSTPLEDSPVNQLDVQIYRAVAQLNLTGDLEPLVNVFERMEPDATSAHTTWSAYVHLLRRDPDSAIEVLNTPVWLTTAGEMSGESARTFQLASAWYLKGDTDKGRMFDEQNVAILDSVIKAPPSARAWSGSTIAVSLARLERGDEALALANELVSYNAYERDSINWSVPLYHRAMALCLLGDADGAMTDLLELINGPASPYTVWNLHYDPGWDCLRDDPRFIELATPNNLIQ